MEQMLFPVTRREAERSGIQYSSEANKNARFPSQLRELRAEKGVSQDALSKVLGVSKSTIGLWENGDTLPDAKAIYDLAEYYGVSANYLLGLSDIKSVSSDVQGICKKTGLDERIAKYLIHLSTSGYSQTIIDYRLFYLQDDSFMSIFNEIFQPENMQDLLEICAKYLRFVQQVESDIETTKYYLENPEEIECPEFYYSFRSYYEDKEEYFKGNLEGEFLSALRENNFFRIEGMEIFSAAFDKFHKKYSTKLESEICEIREKLSP